MSQPIETWETNRPVVAWLLFALNLLVFLMMAARSVSPLSPAAEETLQNWGASYGPLVTAGEWWRLLASAFVHAGIPHLLISLWLLLFVGAVAERVLGHLGLLVVYLLSALGGSVVGVYWEPVSTGVGASAAIFGLFGALLAFLLEARGAFPAQERSSLRTASIAVAAAGLGLGWINTDVNVAGQVGGLAVGVLAGLLLAATGASSPDRSHARRHLLVGSVGFAVLGLSAWSLPVQDDWSKDIGALFALEGDTQSAIEEATGRVGTGRMTPEAFASHVQREVLPRWRQQRARLAALRVAPRERAIVDKAIVYMDRRATAWELADAPLRRGDASRLEKSQQASAAASDAGREFLRAFGLGRPR